MHDTLYIFNMGSPKAVNYIRFWPYSNSKSIQKLILESFVLSKLLCNVKIM